MVEMFNLENIEGFDWDEGNINKNKIKHNIYYRECEQVLLGNNIISEDLKHSKFEKRYQCLGKTDSGKLIFISFTVRKLKVRVISARPMSRKERNTYEKAKAYSKL